MYLIGEDKSGALVLVKGSWESGYLVFSVLIVGSRLIRSGGGPKCRKEVRMLGGQKERQMSTAGQYNMYFRILWQVLNTAMNREF